MKQMTQNMSLEDLDGIFGPQTDWSISESRMSYEVHTDRKTISLHLSEEIIFCRLPSEAKKKEEEGNI
jgi:hypothetical protein